MYWKLFLSISIITSSTNVMDHSLRPIPNFKGAFNLTLILTLILKLSLSHHQWSIDEARTSLEVSNSREYNSYCTLYSASNLSSNTLLSGPNVTCCKHLFKICQTHLFYEWFITLNAAPWAAFDWSHSFLSTLSNRSTVSRKLWQ